MAKITIDLDDALVERLTAASRARNVTVEELLRAEVEQAALSPSLEIENTSHRAILSALHRPDGFYESPRDAIHDREHDRAEAHATARDALLALIDTTEGDMGTQIWSRGRAYEP